MNVFHPWSHGQQLSQGLCLTIPQSTWLCLLYVEQNIPICQIYETMRISISLGLFKVRDHGLEGINLSTPYTMLQEVGKGVRMLLDFLA
jgi:hypothetical protein